MKKQSIRTIVLSTFLIFSVWTMYPSSAVAGPGDGKGRQYWKCMWEIACDNSHQYPCSTGGSCGGIF